ncbi:hypothetical protein [Pseudomonas sp.]|uniref:hypothetical protein n=1 Tax=Pseudomonas sp. TaxID=306 RepID=UPI002629E638|nr:hypothetical protein [Pseudomonas sp.]
MTNRQFLTIGFALAALILGACATRPSDGVTTEHEDRIMTPGTTYLYLLKNTPFFTALSKPQLRWVIEHSREWGAESGTVVASYSDAIPASDDLWILLDGAWEVEVGGQLYPAKNNDPGKWFSAAQATSPSKLIVTEHSYVMRIKRADMEAMRLQGFAFDQHLDAGKAYYKRLFQSAR